LEEKITTTRGSRGNKLLGRTHTKQVFGKVGKLKQGNKFLGRLEIKQQLERTRETRHVKKTIKYISKRDRQGWLLLLLQNDTRLQYNLALLVLHWREMFLE